MDGMRISELSARSGVPTSTLRYYEAEGLLPAGRASNGYRVYGPAAVDRLAFIAQAKHLDLPLSSVRELADAWESEPCQSVRAKYRTGLGHARRDLPMADAEPAPIACSLGSGDYSARVKEWRELLAGTPQVGVEGGVRATMPTSLLDRAVGLAVAEQVCCAFYAVRIDLHGSTFDLTLTAPPGAELMLTDLLPATASPAR